VCRQVYLCRADHSSRGVLPTVVRRCLWSRNLVNEEALAHGGSVGPKKFMVIYYRLINVTRIQRGKHVALR
jgi:hypothetical protein